MKQVAIVIYPTGKDAAGTEQWGGFEKPTLAQAAEYHANTGFHNARLIYNGAWYDATPEGFEQARADAHEEPTGAY